jgi:hypothetical protein
MTIAVPFNAAVQICRPSPLHDFNDEVWNADGILQTTNCYTYALNDPRIGWGIPGQLNYAGGVYVPKYDYLTSHNLRCGMMKDGLVEITRAEALSGEFHAVALRVAHRKGFHVYRFGPDELWHHKDGKDLPAAVDADGMPVTDPENVTSPWEEFGGFFAVKTAIPFVPQIYTPTASL